MKPKSKPVYARLTIEDKDYWSKTRCATVQFVGRSEDYKRIESVDGPINYLSLTAQVSADYAKDGFYSYQLRANLDTSDIDMIENAAKMMRKVRKGLDEMNLLMGYENSFAEWVVRVCSILKIDGLISASRYSDQWTVGNIGAIRDEIDKSERQFKQLVNPD